jgi:threonine dehydratase
MLNVPPKGACIDLTLETHGRDHAAGISAALAKRGYGVTRLDAPEP